MRALRIGDHRSGQRIKMTKSLPFIQKHFGHLGAIHAAAVGIAACVFAADQWIKYYVDRVLAMDLHQTIELLPFFDLTRVHNYGASMGVFSASSDMQRIALVALTSFIAIGVFMWMLVEHRKTDVLCLALILGGALGNITDRARLGYVLDYADFHVFGVRPFLVFNLADAAITIGVLIVLARAILMRDKEPNESSKPDQAES